VKASFRRLVNRDALFGAAVSALATAVILLVVLVARGPTPMIVIELRSDILVQRVARPELSAVPMTGAQLAADLACPAFVPAFSGVLKPAEGALVTYQWQPDFLVLEVRPPRITRPDGSEGFAETVFADRDEAECRPALEIVRLRIPSPNPNDPAASLPIAGPTQAGSEFGVPLAPVAGDSRVFELLHEGEVEVFGRSVDGGVVFPTGATYTIPAGSRLTSARSIEAGTSPSGASWYGIASYRPDGLHVSATTETTELRLYRPDPDGQEQVFGIGLFAGLIGDPGLGLTTFMVAVFLTITGLVTGWLGLAPRSAAPGSTPSCRPQAAEGPHRCALARRSSPCSVPC
jgi:hypothetical protein